MHQGDLILITMLNRLYTYVANIMGESLVTPYLFIIIITNFIINWS